MSRPTTRDRNVDRLVHNRYPHTVRSVRAVRISAYELGVGNAPGRARFLGQVNEPLHPVIADDLVTVRREIERHLTVPAPGIEDIHRRRQELSH